MKYIHPRRVLRSLSKKTQELPQRLLEQKVSHNYSRVLRRLRKKLGVEKIRVVFYANEPQKWSYESLYREFEKSPLFEPLVVVVPRYRVHIGEDNTRMTLEEQYDFFKSRNYNVEYGYINGGYVEIKAFYPDIFFYLQLAEVPGIDDPLIVSKNAITCYCPYAYQLPDLKRNYLQSFHKLLYVYYVEHELALERFERYGKGYSQNCVAVGYPKLDVYFDCETRTKDWQVYWKEPEKIKIIYAPHHSFAEKAFNWGTFPENCHLILNLAKTNKETTWVFKPHPMLRRNIVLVGVMTEEEVEAYYDEWARIGRLYDNGDYFDIFKSSDLMITDCGSFLAEYLPSHKPLIRLVNNEGLAFNELGERLSNCYYNVYNNEELLHMFDEVVKRGNDYLRDDRNRIADSLVDREVPASLKIYEDLLQRIKNERMKFIKRLIKKAFYKLGCEYPSRGDRFLNRIINTVSFFYPKKVRERRKFMLMKKLYTLYYGGQILRTAKSIGKNFYCGGPSCVDNKTVIKDYVCFNGMFINGGGAVTIGSYFHSGIQCMIITQNHDYDTGKMIPYGTGYHYKDVIIEDFVWFGRRVTILPGTHIGEGAIIQSGAVVHGEIPPCAIAGGNPAKVFKYRDIGHFEELKAAGKVLSDELYCELMFGE